MAQPISPAKALREWRLYLFVVPALLLVAVFSYLPVASAIYHSFFDWAGGESKQFIGWGNFRRALSDQMLWKSLGTVSVLMVFNLCKMLPSVLMAVLIHRLKSARAQYAYRVLLVIPMIVPGIVTLFIWKFFFDPNFGALNRLLDATGVKTLLVHADRFFGWGVFAADVPIGWLSQPELVLPALCLWGFPWIGAVGVLIYLSGLQSISQDLYDAAELDGAGPWRKFFHLEFPLIVTQVRITLVLLTISTLQGFGLQLLVLGESGGPAGRGMTPGLWMYNRAFFAGEFGYACAIGLVLFVFIAALTWFNHRYVRVDR